MNENHVLIDGELWEVRQEYGAGFQCDEPDCGDHADYYLLAIDTDGRRSICEPHLMQYEERCC